MLKKLNLIMCYVTDMDASVRFYRDVLGLTLEFQSPDWSQFDLGNGVALGRRGPVAQYTEHRPASVSPGWVTGFEAEDIRAFPNHLEEHVVTSRGDFHPIPGGWTLDCEDPAGNLLESLQRTG